MTFKTEAEVCRYLLEKDGNVVENSHYVQLKFNDLGILVSRDRFEGTASRSWQPAPSIHGYSCKQWRPLEKKAWVEVANVKLLPVYFRGLITRTSLDNTIHRLDLFGGYSVDGGCFVDSYGYEWQFAAPVPVSTIREWLAEAERVERECNL